MVTTTTETSPSSATIRKATIRLALAWVFLPPFFLVTGGSLGWWEAWVYCLLLLVPMTVFVVRMARKDPEFLERRLTFKEKERTQRRVVSWGTPLILVLFVIPGLDRRFGWSEPPVALGSWWAVIPAVLYAPVLVVRIVNEEAVLVRELPGYEEYRKKVRYRLLPLVW